MNERRRQGTYRNERLTHHYSVVVNAEMTHRRTDVTMTAATADTGPDSSNDVLTEAAAVTGGVAVAEIPAHIVNVSHVTAGNSGGTDHGTCTLMTVTEMNLYRRRDWCDRTHRSAYCVSNFPQVLSSQDSLSALTEVTTQRVQW